MSENYFIDGIPIDKKYKVIIVVVGFILLVINHNLHIVHQSLDYPYRDIVSLVLLAGIVIISIGSKLAEGIIIGLALFTVMSVWYDLSVLDVTGLRKGILIGGVIVLIVATFFGKISIFNIFKNQLGLAD